MNVRFNSEQRKTWDGLRWLFVLLASLFAAICAWLLFQQGLQGDAKLLLLIPAIFCIGSAVLALVANDQLLKKVASCFIVFH